MKSQINIRASALLQRQLDELTAHLGTSITETVSIAIDRLHQQEIKNMNSYTSHLIARTAIYKETDGTPGRPLGPLRVPLHEQHISLVVSEMAGIWYTADVGTEAEDRQRLEEKAKTLLGKPIDPNTMFYSGEATYALGTNPYASDVLFPKESFPPAG